MDELGSDLEKYGIGAVVFAATLVALIYLLKVFTRTGIEEAIKSEFSRGLEGYKSQLSIELEKLKSSLNKSQTIFSRQLEALTGLRTIFRRILPKKRFPEMEWDDACEDIALCFEAHADSLDDFLCSHAAVLPNDVLRNVETAISIATEGVFELRWSKAAGMPEATHEAIKAADKFYDTVRDAVTGLQTAVDAQIDQRRPSTD